MLLRHGRVWDEGSTWTQCHGAWLARQRFAHVESELAFSDYLATVDAAAGRKLALAERLSRLAQEDDLWHAVLGDEALPDAPGGVALLGWRLEVGDQPLVDERAVGAERRRRSTLGPPSLRRQRRGERLANRAAMHAVALG